MTTLVFFSLPLENYCLFSRTCLARKGLAKTRRRRSTGQPPGTKSGRRIADKLRVNRGLCSSIGLHWISFVRVSEESFRTVVFDALGGKRVGCSLGEPTRRRPVLPGPVRPAAPPCAAPPQPRQWYVRVLGSTGKQLVFKSFTYVCVGLSCPSQGALALACG